MACFSEQISPISTWPCCRAKTWGRSMAVSVMPRSWCSPDLGFVPGDDEEPGPVRSGVDVVPLDGSVNPLLVFRKMIQVQLRGGGQGLDHVLQGVSVAPGEQVEEQDRNLGVGEEQGKDVALAQILAHGIIVGEVAVVDQSLVEPHKGMGSARVPDPALGGIALVGDPDVGLKLLEHVEPDHLLGVAHDLEDHHVLAVGEHKGPLGRARLVEGLVEVKGVLKDELVLYVLGGPWNSGPFPGRTGTRRPA